METKSSIARPGPLETELMSFGEFLLDKKAVTPEDLLRCVDYRRWMVPFIGTLAVNNGFVDAVQVLKVVEICETERRHFGEVATELGFVTTDQVQTLLDEQASSLESLSACLVKLCILTQVQVEDLEQEYMLQVDGSLTGQG